MPRLKLNFVLTLLLPAFCPGVCARPPGPVAAPEIRLSSASLLEQLAYIPDYSVAPASAAAQEVTEAEVVDLEEGEDSEASIFISSAMAQAPEPVNLGGNGSLTLIRQDTREKINARYRNKDGGYNPDELARITRLMRCTLTGREARVSIKLVELLDAVEDKFGKKGLTLLSGYRTPKFNAGLPGAAKQSLHMLGWAADIKIPGYSSAKVKKYGQKLSAGGVGYYPYKGFTHLDVGKSRYWVVRRPPRRRRARRNGPAARKTAARKAPAAGKTSAGRKPAKNRS